MKRYGFMQVDVFTERPFVGNPVAVVLGAEDLHTEAMQQLARWTNLSETAFILPPVSAGADYRVRIFTPTQELPFAGHPTVGCAHAVLESGFVKSKPRLVQECGIGPVNLRVDTDLGERIIFFESPRAKISELEESRRGDVAAALGLKREVPVISKLIDVGPKWLVNHLPSADRVHGLTPDLSAIRKMSDAMQITGFVTFSTAEAKNHQIYLRAFAPAHNIPEDPVCGSGNACVAAFLVDVGWHKKVGLQYVANQGVELNRNGLISVSIAPDASKIEVGGRSVTCISGHIRM